jgi:NTE family protein
MQREMVRWPEISADVMIRPMVEQYSSTAFKDVNEIIAIGEEAGRKQIPYIQEKIQKWKESHS